MGLDHFKIEGDNPIEKSLIGSKPRAMFRLMVQSLPHGGGCLSQCVRLLSVRRGSVE